MADAERPEVIEPDTSAGAQARWTWLAALGLLLAGIGPLLMLVVSVVWGLSGDDIPFFLVTAVIAFVASYLVRRFGTWAKVVGILAGLVVGMMLFWTAFGLATPQSFFDFAPGLLVMPGALIAIVSCIGAIVAGRRNHLSDAPVGGERKGIRIVLTAILGLAALSAVLTIAAAMGGAEGEPTVAASDFDFEPRTLEVDGGETIVISNEDPFGHTFTIDELDINEVLSAGQKVEVEIPDDGGTYIFYCMPHTSTPKEPSDEDMAGELTIR